jgi:hypothetical protein
VFPPSPFPSGGQRVRCGFVGLPPRTRSKLLFSFVVYEDWLYLQLCAH